MSEEKKIKKPEFYTMQEVADILGVTRQSVRNYMNAGKLHGVRIGGWKFPAEEVERVLKYGIPDGREKNGEWNKERARKKAAAAAAKKPDDDGGEEGK